MKSSHNFKLKFLPCFGGQPCLSITPSKGAGQGIPLGQPIHVHPLHDGLVLLLGKCARLQEDCQPAIHLNRQPSLPIGQVLHQIETHKLPLHHEIFPVSVSLGKELSFQGDFIHKGVGLQKLILQKDHLVVNWCEATSRNYACFLQRSDPTECCDWPNTKHIFSLESLFFDQPWVVWAGETKSIEVEHVLDNHQARVKYVFANLQLIKRNKSGYIFKIPEPFQEDQ